MLESLSVRAVPLSMFRCSSFLSSIAADQALAAQIAARAVPLSSADMQPASVFKYHYKDLHPPQFQSTFTKIVFNPDVEIFRMTDTQLRGALRIAVEKTLQEFLMPCVERCLRYNKRKRALALNRIVFPSGVAFQLITLEACATLENDHRRVFTELHQFAD